MKKSNANEVIGRLDRKVRRLNSGLSSVHETTRLLTGPMRLQQVLEIVVKTVAETMAADAAGLRLLDEDTGRLELKATYGLSDTYKNKGPVTAAESELNKRALGGEVIVVDDMRTHPQFIRYHNQVVREGVISSLSIGMRYKDKGVGILRLYNRKSRDFSEADISLAMTVASQSAAAIINARLYQDALKGERLARQLRLAGAVQRHLIPKKSPALPGIDLAGVYVPCYDVGGDFYDFIPLPNGRVVLAIGDIMGKGIPASLAMASVRSFLRASAEMVDSAAELAAKINRMFCHDAEHGEFATLFCGILAPDGRLIYCNCGHEPPVLFRGDQIIELKEGGTVIGLDPQTAYQQQQITLETDDMLIMYTDGLADAVNFQRESFGRDRIIEAALSSRQLSADQAAKNILWLMRKFTGLTRRFDDTALIVLKKTN